MKAYEIFDYILLDNSDIYALIVDSIFIASRS